MSRFHVLGSVFVVVAGCTFIQASETDALAIDANLQAKHIPFGTILDPIYTSASSDQIKDYTRCGDSALWTGAYLAAESFRYNVTRSPDAFANMQKALAGLKALVDVTGINLLARCMVPQSWPYAASIQSQEASNGIHIAEPWIWIGNTSRDEYTGVIFGLGVAYDMTDDATMKSAITDLVTRLVRYLTGHNWSVNMPDGSSSTTFLVRPDEMLALLQVGRHVNPSQFSTYYAEQRILLGDTGTVLVPPGVDVMDDTSYFKFNLDYMTLYNLVRLEGSSTRAIYEKAYSIVRNHTAGHLNAFFDLIDRGLEGSNVSRDAEALTLLNQWLVRPHRDPTVDLSKTVAVCGSQACQPIPVPLRPPADFLWQISPFQLSGGGSGIVENPGVDYLLPYWMSRYYGVAAAFSVESSASGSSLVSPDSLGSLFGSALAAQTAQAGSANLPAELGGVTVAIKDANGAQYSAPLIYVSPGQINFQVPKGVAAGTATFTIANGSTALTATGQIQTVAPAIFSMNGNGTGVAAATAIRTTAGDPQVQNPVTVFQCASTGCTPVPIALGADAPVFVALYGTGIRNASSLANVNVTINGISVPVSYAGPQPQYPGFDQVNIGLPLDLQGAGESNVVVTVDGHASNTVTLNIQ